MDFGVGVFHQCETSLQAHLGLGEDRDDAVFALFNLHMPGASTPYASLHVVAPDKIDLDVLPQVMTGLREVVHERLGVVLDAMLLTVATEPGADSDMPDVQLSIQRHRPSSTSSRDLVLASDEPAEGGDAAENPLALVAVFERFRDGDDTMTVLVVVDHRFRNRRAAERLLAIVDANIGSPGKTGSHDLDILYANFRGELAARPADENG